MADKTVWELDPHTAAKHVILRKYLNAWLPKITRWNKRVIFCDGFAGPGVYSNGEDGSPTIAIKAFLEHSYRDRVKANIRYLFIEENEARCQSLRNVVGRLRLPDSVDVLILNETYQDAFTELLDFMDEQEAQLAPTFAFIDPFGIRGLPLETIKRLMAHRSCEVLVTVMVGYMNRFISRPEFEPHCDELFGTDAWRAAIELEGSARESHLRNLYQRRLLDPTSGVGARYARYFTMKDGRGVTIYDLFFATNHPKGIDAMKDAMWNVDQTGEYSFSDATNPDQEMLFTTEPDWQRLVDILADQFAADMVPWPRVEEAIRQTPFRILKTPLKKLAKGDKARLEIINANSASSAISETTKIRFRS
jgi:three-Cys-motif partner protein